MLKQQYRQAEQSSLSFRVGFHLMLHLHSRCYSGTALKQMGVHCCNYGVHKRTFCCCCH